MGCNRRERRQGPSREVLSDLIEQSIQKQKRNENLIIDHLLLGIHYEIILVRIGKVQQFLINILFELNTRKLGKKIKNTYK